MKNVKALLLSLIFSGLLTPATVFSHPGHQHDPGLLARIDHAVIGWDQLVIVLITGVAAAVIYFSRSK